MEDIWEASIKLLNCKSCDDILALQGTSRSCFCGRSRGYVIGDSMQAVFTGPARVLGIPQRAYLEGVCRFGETDPVYPWKVYPNKCEEAEKLSKDDAAMQPMDWEEDPLEEDWPEDMKS